MSMNRQISRKKSPILLLNLDKSIGIQCSHVVFTHDNCWEFGFSDLSRTLNNQIMEQVYQIFGPLISFRLSNFPL